jgi:hypothetical protein
MKIGMLIREAGEKRTHDVEEQYCSRKFVNLRCDAGTVQSLRRLYSLVTNPFSSAPPLIVDLVDPDGFCGPDYSRFFHQTLESLFEKDLVICGVIIDNLAAQRMGLRQVLQSVDAPPAVRTIVHVPCFCHSINLVFANTVRHCPFLNTHMEIVSHWEAVFRTRFARRVIECKPRCPSIPKTRWLYATGPLQWILAHSNEIETLIAMYQGGEDEETERARRSPALAILSDGAYPQHFEKMQDGLRLLGPLRILCDRLERRDASLSNVIPAVRETLTAYRELDSAGILVPESYEIFKHIASRFIARMATSVPELCVTAYVLSSGGKLEIQRREHGFAVADLPPGDDEPAFAQRTDIDEEERNADDRETTEVAEIGSSDDDEMEEIFETDWDREEDELEELTSYRKLQQELFATGDIELMLNFPLYDDLMGTARSCIASFAKILGFSTEQAIESLHNWIVTPSDVLGFPLVGNRSPDTIWRNAHIYDAWREFSEVALRVVTLGTSEADVERIISVHRDIASLKSTRYSHATIRSRLQLRVSKVGRNKDRN